MLTIAVCIKQVVDPEAPLSLFQIAPDGKNLVPPPGTPPVLSAFDENALEAALKIIEQKAPDAELTFATEEWLRTSTAAAPPSC